MLTALILVPLAMGAAFRFGVPILEDYLCQRLGMTAVLISYYPLFDLLLSIMTPIMFTAAGAMVILEEADSGLAKAIAVTPIGRGGYLASRIGVPSLLAAAYCAVVTLVFRLSGLSALKLLLLAVCSGVLSITTALMISALAKNKVEGLAYSKLTGLFVLGVPAAILIPAPIKYASGFLPTFWMTELTLGGSVWLALPALATSLFLSLLFVRHFKRKILD